MTSAFESSGFNREKDESCVLLGNYAEYSCNSLPTFYDKFRSRKVCTKLPLHAA